MLRFRNVAWAKVLYGLADLETVEKQIRTVKNANSCYFVDTLSDCSGNPAKFGDNNEVTKP